MPRVITVYLFYIIAFTFAPLTSGFVEGVGEGVGGRGGEGLGTSSASPSPRGSSAEYIRKPIHHSKEIALVSFSLFFKEGNGEA